MPSRSTGCTGSSLLTGTSIMARASSIFLRTTPVSFTSPGTVMSTGASGPTCQSPTRTPLGRGGAEASLSTCPGTRSGWEMLTTWPPSCTCYSPWPLSLILSWC